MTSVLLLTSEGMSHDDLDTAPVARALLGRGAEVITAPWDAPEAALPTDITLIRTTWDYFGRLDEFLAALARRPGVLLNPLDVVRWNANKRYLTELAAAGAPILPTLYFQRGVAAELPAADFAASGEVIIKPAVGGGACGVGRFAAGSPAAADFLAELLATADALVQPYRPEVTDGERSLIYLDGVYSHAVHKVPAAGEYRVQEIYGGRVVAHIATDADREAAERTLAAAPADLLYARVDIIGPTAHPEVMELELIEPELFLPGAPGAAERLADGLLARL